MAYWYVNYGDGSTTGYYGVTQWSATTAKTVSSIVRQLAVPTNGNERCFVCVVAGTTGAAEPAWNLTPQARTIDGTANWIECTGQQFSNGRGNSVVAWLTTLGAVTVGQVTRGRAVNTSGIFMCTTAGTVGAIEPTWNVTTAGSTTTDGTAVWTYMGLYSIYPAFGAPIARLATVFTYNAPSDLVFVGDNHAETQTTAMTISAANPMTHTYCIDHTRVGNLVTDLRNTATITNAAIVAMNISGRGYFYGLNFTVNGAAAINIQTVSGNNFGTIVFENCTFATQGNIIFGIANTGSGFVTFNNSSVRFLGPNSTQRLRVNSITFNWYNSLAVVPGSTTLAGAGLISCQDYCNVLCEAVDFSTCPVAVVDAVGMSGRVQLVGCLYPVAVANPVVAPVANNWYVDTMQTDNAGNFYRTERYRGNGTQLTETTIVRAGGATDGITAISWKIAVSAILTNTGLGRPFYSMPLAIWNTIIGVPRTATVEVITDGVTLNNASTWIEAVYYGTAGSTLASFASGQPVSVMDTPVNWPNSAAGWNTTGLAAPIRQRLTVTFTPQAVGFVTIYVLVAPTSGGTVSYTVYVDPKVSLS